MVKSDWIRLFARKRLVQLRFDGHNHRESNSLVSVRIDGLRKSESFLDQLK